MPFHSCMLYLDQLMTTNSAIKFNYFNVSIGHTWTLVRCTRREGHSGKTVVVVFSTQPRDTWNGHFIAGYNIHQLIKSVKEDKGNHHLLCPFQCPCLQVLLIHLEHNFQMKFQQLFGYKLNLSEIVLARFGIASKVVRSH